MGIVIPSGAAVLELERRSRRQGSGLTRAELAGCWRLQQLWSKGSAQASPAAAALLRSLQASLSLEPDATGDSGALRVQNSVQLGPLQLRFRGPGQLRGRRPLLEFWFEELALQWGAHTLWRQTIAAPADGRRRPFFALIGRLEGNGLVARGRGGGLAFWVLQSPGS